jgi:3'-phosphoadenosine 5'-phosphosulfate sulfotransferase (PAPS reductase)/FAD synthetase
MQVLSLSGGVCSGSLYVLSALGDVKPAAELAVYIDTGAEMPEAKESVARLREWGKRHGGAPIETYRQRPGLYDVHFAGLPRGRTPLPLHTTPNGGVLARECTLKWKVRPTRRCLRGLGIRKAVLWIGYTVEERERCRDSRVQWVQYRWPLIELGMKRDDCVTVFKEAGLPVPVRTGCWLCPLHPHSVWEKLAVRDPRRFALAVELEEWINAGRAAMGKDEVFFSPQLVLLSDIRSWLK